MIDRCNCLMPYVQQSDGTYDFERRIRRQKNGVFLEVAGTDQEFDTILTTVKGSFNWANAELVETILYAHDDNEIGGGVKKDEKQMNQAFEIGVRIIK